MTALLWRLITLLFCVTVQSTSTETDNDTLVLVHVLFRHGDRTPEQNNLTPDNPYFNESNYKPGYGQLTQKGKTRAYTIGTTLRKRYGNFLGTEYNINLVEGRSSDFNRTKDTLQLVFAGLFPPVPGEEFVPDLKWQPIPYNYVERSKDKELFCFGCPRWDELWDATLEHGKAKVNDYNKVFDIVNNQTGQHITDIKIMYYYYFGFEIQEELGMEIPVWAKEVYPQPLLNLTITYYDFMYSTHDLKRMAGGYLMKKIVSDIEHKINNTLIPKQRKMFLYSGHENNIASMLELLNLRKKDGVPPYGTQVLMELHKINGTYGIKIFYNDMKTDIVAMKIPGYEDFIPFEDFKSYVHDYIDMDDSLCTGKASSSITGKFIVILSSWLLIHIFSIY